MIELIILISLVIISKLLGKMFFNFLKINFVSLYEELVFCVGVGLAIISYFVFFVGLIGFLHRLFFVSLISLFIIYFLFEIIKNLKRFSIRVQKNFFLFYFLILTILIYFISTYLPITESDSLTYHLTIPKYFVLFHRIYNISDIIKYSTFPQLVEMLFLVGMLLKDEILASQIHFLFAILTIISIFIFAKKFFGSKEIGFLGAIFYLLSRPVKDLVGTAKVDFAVCFYFFMMFYSLFNSVFTDEKRNEWFLVSGIFCAFCFSVKYTGIIYLTLPFLFYLCNSYFKKGYFKVDFKIWIKFLMIYFVIISPWLIRNYFYTGNPFSPFLNKIFADRSLNSYLIEDLKLHLESCKKLYSVKDYFKNFFGIFYDIPELNFFIFSFFGKVNYYILLIIFFSFIYLLLGLLFFPYAWRFFLPSFVLLFLLSAKGVYQMIKQDASQYRKKILKYITFTFFIIFVTTRFLELNNKIFEKDNILYLLGKINKNCYLTKKLSFYPVVNYVNKHLTKNDKILSLNETRGYYFIPKFIVSHHTRVGSVVHTSKDIEEIIESLKLNKIYYIFTNHSDYFLRHQRKTILTDGKILRNYFDLVFYSNKCYLYKIKEIK